MLDFKQFSLALEQSLDRILPGATTPGQGGSRTDGNKRVHPISQSSSFTGTSLSDFSVSYLGQSLGESYPSVEMQLVYSAATADWANKIWRRKKRKANIEW